MLGWHILPPSPLFQFSPHPISYSPSPSLLLYLFSIALLSTEEMRYFTHLLCYCLSPQFLESKLRERWTLWPILFTDVLPMCRRAPTMHKHSLNTC